tara:strand:+ start:2570 stop:3145 length:576 start_codon:yes stop_codon:yes gene_type:complete
MAYPKITVNTGLAQRVIASDSIPIPYPNLPQLTGVTTATTANKLVDVGADFSNVVVGDIVYNDTDLTVATVTEVETSTILVLSADIMTSGETYTIFQGGPIFEQRIDSSSGCLLYVGSNASIVQDIQATSPADPGVGTADPRYVDVAVKVVQGNTVVFQNFKVGNYLPVQVTKLMSTGTSAAVRQNCIAIW